MARNIDYMLLFKIALTIAINPVVVESSIANEVSNKTDFIKVVPPKVLKNGNHSSALSPSIPFTIASLKSFDGTLL